LWLHLETLQLEAQFYSFRWLTLLLCQEFELPDVMRLWDSLFADSRRAEHWYLNHICVAMLVTKRDELLTYDFAQALKMLQRYPIVDICKILDLADQILEPVYKASNFTLTKEQGGDGGKLDIAVAALTDAWSNFSSKWSS